MARTKSWNWRRSPEQDDDGPGGPTSPLVDPPGGKAGDEVGADHGWLLGILLGTVLVGLGLWMLANLSKSVVVLAWLVGLSLIAGGISEIMALGGRRAPGWAATLTGGLLVAAGLVVLAWPDITIGALAVVAGLALLLSGSLRAADALMYRSERPDWTRDLVVGGLGIALGLAVLAWPEATVLVVAVVFGLRAILTGILVIGVGWQLHRLAA